MSPLTKKIRTISRVVRRQGVSGMASLISEKAAPVMNPPRDYARLAPSAVAYLARHGRPDVLITAHGAGIGDDLLCTAIMHELRVRGQQRVWIRSAYPELFRHNDDVPVVAPPLPRFDAFLGHLGTRVVHPWYTGYNPAFDRDDPIPEQHLIAIMCQKAGIQGPVTLRPYLVLNDAERAAGVRRPRQIAIQSSGLSAKHAMRNKNWELERYQGVVDALRGTYEFVQVGSPDDPLLTGTLDLRGQTTLRETAAVLAGSLAFVGQVGFLMHLARAVDCRSVIVYGGRETPAQSGYPCNENLYSAVSCSPCWRLNSCPYERKCLKMIEVGDVVDAVERQVVRYGEPLPVDVETITAAQIAHNAARHKKFAAIHAEGWSAVSELPQL